MTQIRWTDTSLIAAFLSRCSKRIGALLPFFSGAQSGNHTASSNLDVFQANLPMEGLSSSRARKVAETTLASLLPVSPDHLIIYGRINTHTKMVELAAVRKQDLERLSKNTHHLMLDDDWYVLAPVAEAQNNRRNLIVAVSLTGFIAGLSGIYLQALSAYEQSVQEALEAQNKMRQLALQTAAVHKDSQLWEALKAQKIYAMAPGRVYKRLSDLNAATPKNAYWLSLTLDNESARIHGRSKAPIETLEALSGTASTTTVQFAEPLTGQDEDGWSDIVIEVKFNGE